MCTFWKSQSVLRQRWHRKTSKMHDRWESREEDKEGGRVGEPRSKHRTGRMKKWKNRHEIRWRLFHLFSETNPGGFLPRPPPWGSTDNPNPAFTDLEAATGEHILSNLLCSPVKSDPRLIPEQLSAPKQQKRDNLGSCFRLLHRSIHKSHRRHFRNFTYSLFSGNHNCKLDNQKHN